MALLIVPSLHRVPDIDFFTFGKAIRPFLTLLLYSAEPLAKWKDRLGEAFDVPTLSDLTLLLGAEVLSLSIYDFNQLT